MVWALGQKLPISTWFVEIPTTASEKHASLRNYNFVAIDGFIVQLHKHGI
jgi:hypothetical protein